MIAVRDHHDHFGDAEIAVVTFGDPSRLGAHRQHLGVPFPVLADPALAVYGLFGVARGSRRQVWSAGTLRMYARLLRDGRRLQRSTEDVRQLGADAVIGRDGRLRYLSRPSSPDTRPPVAELIAALD
ncbi:MAG TPA: AhpC/TSA family protein [Acidimicrobiales bacterium]|nr:AhpC/TSA family protein [Acidimicrobiales bacterium]